MPLSLESFASPFVDDGLQGLEVIAWDLWPDLFFLLLIVGLVLLSVGFHCFLLRVKNAGPNARVHLCSSKSLGALLPLPCDEDEDVAAAAAGAADVVAVGVAAATSVDLDDDDDEGEAA